MNNERKKQYVCVTTRNPDDPDHPRRQVVDYSGVDARKWLSSHILWAVSNGHSVTVFGTDERPNYFPKQEQKDRRRENRAAQYERNGNGNGRRITAS